MARVFSGNILAAACALALLGGCTPAQQFALESGTESVRQAKDSEARLLKASVCAMSIGAYHRLNSSLEQRALDVLCGGIDGALTGAEVLQAPR